MSDRLCDLHAHSTASDGSLTPTQLVQLAVKSDLRALVLCDHNTVAGLDEFVAAAHNTSLEAVPGVEFSTEFEGAEPHILALFVEPCHYSQLNSLLDAFKRRKEQSNRHLVAALESAGIYVDYKRLEAEHGYINRAVVAQEMYAKGYCTSVKDAFDRYLAPERGFYVPPRMPDALQTIELIKSLGLVTVLAHPFLSMDEHALRRFLPLAKKGGLDAMETRYSKYDAATTALAEKLAAEMDLLPSGGSDFHGDAKPDIFLGKGRGNMEIPYDFLVKLRERKNFGKKQQNREL